eukprot:SAG31_NODE_1986_length_6725_cov_3.779505_3_plen_367_part_00
MARRGIGNGFARLGWQTSALLMLASLPALSCGGGPQQPEGMKWLWATPVYVTMLNNPVTNRALLRAIEPQFEQFLAQHAEEIGRKTRQSGDHRVNDIFFAWQRDQEAAYIKTRRQCVESVGGVQNIGQASDCMDRAVERWWPELRDTVEYRSLIQELEGHIDAYLAQLGHVRPVGAGGRAPLWTWIAVHTDGVSHPLHDHPGTLVSGTYYIDIPIGSGALKLQDPRLGLLNGEFRQRHSGLGQQIKRPQGMFEEQASIAPATGKLVLFPGWLPHRVEATDVEGTTAGRVSMSFNVRGSWNVSAQEHSWKLQERDGSIGRADDGAEQPLWRSIISQIPAVALGAVAAVVGINFPVPCYKKKARHHRK